MFWLNARRVYSPWLNVIIEGLQPKISKLRNPQRTKIFQSPSRDGVLSLPEFEKVLRALGRACKFLFV